MVGHLSPRPGVRGRRRLDQDVSQRRGLPAHDGRPRHQAESLTEATMDLGSKDKSVLVTGGSKGIGLAIAELFAAEGANVAICARNAYQVDGVVKSIATTGGKAWGRAID